MKTAAIILAGGESRRMGTPKALLTYRGQTFLDSLVSLFQTDAEPVVVVLGHAPDVIQSGLKSSPVFVQNESWQAGQLSSLQAGLRAVPPDVEAVFYTPVDFPAIPPSVPGALRSALRPDNQFAVPSFQGKHGHPILFRSALIPEFLALGLNQTAREVVHRHMTSTVYVDIPHPGVVTDIDVPEDYEALVAGEW